MKKSIICLFLVLALTFSCLCGCDMMSLGDFLPMGGDSAEPTPRPTVAPPFESYEAMITRDDLVLWMEADPTSEILGTVSSGDTLHVLQIVNINGTEWASTDRGWIYAEHVQTPVQSIPQAPIYDGTNAMVIAASSDVHVSPDPSSSTRGTLTSGDRITISQITHYASTAMVYVGNGWVKLYDILYDGCTKSGVIPCIVTYDGMNVRSGPSTNYASVGKASAGTQILVRGIMNSDMKGKPWAVTNENKWYFLEYLQLPEGIIHIEGDNADYPFPPKEGESESAQTPSGTNNQHSHVSARPTANNGAIADSWVRYDKTAFLEHDGGREDSGFRFTASGEVWSDPPSELSAYSYQDGSFITGYGGACEYGHYTFDGSTLTITYYCVSYAAEHEIYATPTVYTYPATLNGNFLTINGETYYKMGNRPDRDLIPIYMSGSTAPYVKSEYVGTWQMADGSTLTLKDDGTFTETEGGNTYTGDYLITSGNMYLNRAKKNGNPQTFYLYGTVSLSGDTLRYGLYMWFDVALEKEYTRVTE